VNLIRDAVRLVMQELIELEATETIGASRYERTDARMNERNGHRSRLLATQAGDIELPGSRLTVTGVCCCRRSRRADALMRRRAKRNRGTRG
jgi:hypothetical protein